MSRPGCRRVGSCLSGQLCMAVVAIAIAFAVAPAQAQSGANANEVERLQKRVEQLEGQLVDLQVVIGTLESLARAPSAAPGAPASGAPVAGDDGRISALETQVRALTAQIEQLSQGGGPPSANLRPSTPPTGAQPGPTAFGSTTVTPRNDSIGGLITNSARPADGLRGGAVGTVDETPDVQYEAAYGALLQQNYTTAEAGFSQFLQDNPRHRLAGNAQYWLGEVYFVQGDYRAAANAFLNGYQTYGQSSKAADSLLKLAMSLNRLGARDDACASLKAIAQRYPDAPDHVLSRAQTEGRQMGCRG